MKCFAANNRSYYLSSVDISDELCKELINEIDYQAPLELAKIKISVRYNPFNPESVQVYCDAQRYADAYPLKIPEQVDFTAVTEAP